MGVEFDAGYGAEPFTTLCREFPGPQVYPPARFRVEWGPIFHRGRLDGSARVLVIGQDPAQHEAVVRRILVGEAGRRVQGFLAKLGIERSYVMVNAFLYSVYGRGSSAWATDAAVTAYRNRWLDALLLGTRVEAVVAFGSLADRAWRRWKATPAGRARAVAYAAVTHPTQPESSSAGDEPRLRAATAQMLEEWNAALAVLHAAITSPDVVRPLRPYGRRLAAADRAPIPSADLPAGVPAWMRDEDGWARRAGGTAKRKRATITITVPEGILP